MMRLKMMGVKQYLVVGFLSLFVLLAGCGGGDSGGATADGSDLAPGVNIISFVKTSDGAKTSSIPTNDTATITIRLLSSSNQPIVNEIVSVSVTSGNVSTPSLTNVKGETTFTISPPSSLLTGSQTGVLTVRYQAESTKTHNFEFVATNSGGGGASSSASSIAFISATPSSLSLKGTGGFGRQETSTLVFKVLDATGQPLKDETVNFKLSTNVGGISLSNASAISNASGEAATVIQAGSVATPVTVTAFTTKSDGTQVSASSSLLTISTGIPDQNSFSLSQAVASVHAWNRDNETVEFTVRLSDRFNNPVPDGTAVQFTTEGGQIEPTCTIENGACSVEWTSSDPRPADGRVTVMAFAIGNEYFSDRNGNGVFDDGDIFADQGEAFRDDDESETFNPADNMFGMDENLRDYDGNGLYSGPDGKFNGVLCQHSTDCPTSANNIAGRSNLYTNVVKSSLLIMASDSPSVRFYENTSGVASSCINDVTGHILGHCTLVSSKTLNQETRFNIIVQDQRALCETPTGQRINNVVTPEDLGCTILKRQSIPTDSTIATSASVGVVTGSNNMIDRIPHQASHHEYSILLAPSETNGVEENGQLEVQVGLPTGSTMTYGIPLTDLPSAPLLTSPEAQAYTVSTTIDVLSFANSGGQNLLSCTVAPALPDGLSLSQTSDSSSCRITGTPMAVTPQETYSVTATNQTGSSTATVSITVN